VQSVKKEAMTRPLSDIAKITGVSSLDYDLERPQYNENGQKIAIPINSRAALITNRIIDNREDFRHRYNKIQANDKMKMLYLKVPNPLISDVFAFVDNAFAEEFRKYVDFDKNFDKFFLKPLEIMTEPLGWNLRKQTEELDEW
jgi:hypothetical protein